MKKQLKHEHYKAVLFGKCARKDIMKMIRNDNHNLYTVVQNKTSLSAFDDKRYLLEDGLLRYHMETVEFESLIRFE